MDKYILIIDRLGFKGLVDKDYWTALVESTVNCTQAN